MGYLEAYSIVEGTHDKERIFRDDNLDDRSPTYENWARAIIEDCRKQKLSAQVYSLYHDHNELGTCNCGAESRNLNLEPCGTELHADTCYYDVDECACIQYTTDHHPDYSSED